MSFRFGIDLRLRRLLGAVLLVALALALALALVVNAIPSPNANTNTNKNTNANTWHRAKQVHGPRSERVKIVENLVLNQLARGGDTDSNSDSNSNSHSNSETGRGNRTTQSKSKSKSQMNPSITTVGVIDLPQPGTNQRLRSSIVLVVDNDYDDDNDDDDDPNGAVRIEDWLNDCLPPPVDDDSNDTTIDSGSSSNNNNNNSNNDDESIVAVVESLALLCDELVLRVNQRGYDENNNNNNNEEWRAAIRRGTDRRRSAGMSRGNLWRMHNDHESGPSRVVEIAMESTAGDGDNDRSSTAATTTEANSAAATTTRSILFPGTTGLPELKELVASTARKVIVSRSRDAHATAPERRSVPSVSVHYRGRSLSQEPGAGVAAEAVVASNNNNNNNNNDSDSDTRNPPATTKPPIASSRGDDTEVIADVLATARRKLEDLEAKMEELVLAQSSSSSSSSSPMPLLEFGSLVQDVLETAETRLREETGLPEAFRRGLTKNIVAEVQRLYRDQLQALRNYYGQRYEAILDREPEKDGGDENNKDNDKDDDDEATERRWAVGAEHMTQGFRAAARNAVPVCFRIDANSNAHANIDANIDAWFRKEVTDALQGLIRDMMESTERRKEDRAVATLVEADDDENDTDGASPASRKLKFRFPEVPKWLERLAARAVVFGVNYIQGWLAWQGIKRAALERDRNQPKFPLF